MKKITSYSHIGYFSLTLTIEKNEKRDRERKLPCIKIIRVHSSNLLSTIWRNRKNMMT